MTIKVIILLTLLGVTTCQSVLSLEESTLLHEVLDQYSVSMAINFLHERINTNLETIKKTKSNQIYLDKSNRDTLTLAEKSLSILDQHLTAMEKADYFDYDGTEKIKQYIEQFTMNLEMFPIQSQLDSKWELEMANNVDQVIARSKSKDNDPLIIETNQMIKNYLDDLEKKETDQDNSRLQKLSASLAKAKLEPLVNYRYSLPTVESDCQNYHYHYQPCPQKTIDNRKGEIEIVLKKVKKIVDLFYSKFNYLGNANKSSRSKIVVRPQTPSTTSAPIELETQLYRWELLPN